MNTFNMGIRNTIDLEPADFLRMKQEHPENIKNVEIIPPVLGQPGFGKMRVTLRVPRYEVNF